MKPQGVLGVFNDMGVAAAAIRALKGSGYPKLEVMAPAPHHELEEALEPERSPLKYITMCGSFTGFTCAVLLTFGTAADWPLVVGGKYVWAWQAYVIIMFELTVLLSAIFTLVGFILLSKLPHTRLRLGYDPRFSNDRIGIWIALPREKWDAAAQALKSHGAEEVKLEG
ncbi:MAG: DUF3341 domain-containing protein [Candidatus Eisenbacteria bacterium]|nr:DUF3341 domain-containing protein [Candidatus Eisenbacteria bacterium]